MNKCFDHASTRDLLANWSRTKSQLPEKARFEHKYSRLTRDDSTYGTIYCTYTPINVNFSHCYSWLIIFIVLTFLWLFYADINLTIGLPCVDDQSSLRLFKENVKRRTE